MNVGPVATGGSARLSTAGGWGHLFDPVGDPDQLDRRQRQLARPGLRRDGRQRDQPAERHAATLADRQEGGIGSVAGDRDEQEVASALRLLHGEPFPELDPQRRPHGRVRQIWAADGSESYVGRRGLARARPDGQERAGPRQRRADHLASPPAAPRASAAWAAASAARGPRGSRSWARVKAAAAFAGSRRLTAHTRPSW